MMRFSNIFVLGAGLLMLQRTLAIGCPSDTVATFADITTPNSMADIPNPYLGLTWANGKVMGGTHFSVSGYNTVANSSSGFAAYTDPFYFGIVSFAPLCPWGIGTVTIAPAWNYGMTVTFTGFRDSQDDCVFQVTLPSPFVATTVDLTSCGLLQSLEITTAGGTDGIGGTGTALAFSNVQIFTVPPPPTTSPSAAPSASPSTSPPPDPIAISAASYGGQSSVQVGGTYSLLVTLSLPPATDADRRKLTTTASRDRHGLDRTTYVLLLDVPGTGNVTYKHTSVRPRLKPAFKKPATQMGGDLLWADVPMPLYAKKNSTRTFKMRFKINEGAISPLTFVASVWKDGTKLQTTAPVQVTVTGKST